MLEKYVMISFIIWTNTGMLWLHFMDKHNKPNQGHEPILSDLKY